MLVPGVHKAKGGRADQSLIEMQFSQNDASEVGKGV
jgi:hypothetical protein